jgi:nitrous oxidase accessory protein NosD
MLIDWTEAPEINPVENNLTVTAIGDEFTFFVNGNELDRFQDNRLRSGKVGIAVTAFYPNLAIFEFDNFELIGP